MFKPVKVRQYIEFMKAKGYSAEATLTGSGVEEAMLQDAEFLIDIQQARTIVSNMIALTGDQGIGLEIGAKTELMDLGITGYVMMSAQTAREALQYWINYSNTLVGMLAELRLEEFSADDWALQFLEPTPLGFIRNFCVEELLTMARRLCGVLTSTTPRLTKLELDYPAPAHFRRYEEHFDGVIEFNATQTRMHFASPQLDHRVRGNDQRFNELCAQRCDLLVWDIQHNGTLIPRIRVILMRSRNNIPSLQALAKELRMSSRTLRRHLHEENTSYKKLINEFRKAMALEYIESASISTKEIAFLLGYNDANAFRRAFKEWTGKSVQEYRREGSTAPPRASTLEGA